MSFADEQIVYRDLAGPWGSFRLWGRGGLDVSEFRGAPVQIGGYQLTEPYSYGPADFRFPLVSIFEDGAWGTGDLEWFDLGRPLRLVQVDADGVYVRDVWRGFITQIETGADGAEVHCDGEASGRLALRDKHDEIFYWTKPVESLLWEAFNRVNLRLSPHLGIGFDSGISFYERGRSGGSYLDYADQLLAESVLEDGSHLTVRADGAGGYDLVWKDRATVNASVDLGAAGVHLSPSRDLQEEPTTIYGHGRNPNGQLWVNAKVPGLMQGTIPDFPGTLQLNDTGANVQILQMKLIGMGYLDAEDAIGDTFNAATEEAVEALQEDAGLTVTGVVNQNTWEALFNLNDTGWSLRQAHVAPLAQLSAVRKANRSSNGSKIGFNDGFDPERVEVDLTRDWGVNFKRFARKHEKAFLSGLHNGTPPIVATLELETDLVSGAHTHGTTPAALVSRLDVRPGWNVQVDNYRSGTLFHVAGVNVSSDLKVRLALDTKARDLLHVGKVLERNRESRLRPGRVFLQSRRQTNPNSRMVEFLEFGGYVDMTIDCEALKWTVFPVPLGQSGWLNEVRLQVTDSACEFILAASAKRTGRAWWNRLAPDPFTGWNRERLFTEYDENRAILFIAGDEDQPGGYAPGAKTDELGESTGDPITGLLIDQGGVEYHSFPGEPGGQPVAWFAIFPKQACKIEPQRVALPVREGGI